VCVCGDRDPYEMETYDGEGGEKDREKWRRTQLFIYIFFYTIERYDE
jgi:hypothetical protein